MAPTRESLSGGDKPSAKFILKWLAILIGLAALTLVLVGLFLPREWSVRESVEIAGEREAIHALVSDATRWEQWMFVDEAKAEMKVEAEGQGVGATVRWHGADSQGEITLTESDPERGIAWEGKIDSDSVNNHGSIRYERGESGGVLVVLVDEGELPKVFGGYFVPVMNSALSQHFDAALDRLEVAVTGAPSD